MFELLFTKNVYSTLINMTQNIAEMSKKNKEFPILYLFIIVFICLSVLFIVYIILALRNRKKLLAAINSAKQAEKQAIDANIAKTEIISKITHDLRVPIKKIEDLIEIADNNIDDPDKVQECHDKISISLNHMLTLIENEFDVVKLDKESANQDDEAFDLREMLTSCIAMNHAMAEKMGVSIELKNINEIEYPYLKGKPHFVKQIFTDIFTNVIQYNKPNEKVICSVKEIVHDERSVTYQFSITDTGWILSESVHKQLLKPFLQEDTDAIHKTGVELAVIKRLIEQMHGQVHIESKINVGTTVTMTIPFEINMMTEKKEAKEDVQITGLKVLLVEDNELNAEIAANKLEEAGATVTMAENGQMAIDLFENSIEHDYDIILMDIVMPVLDGLSATRKIRALPREDAKRIPIIAMSANTRDDDIEKAIDAGMNAYITKPIDAKNMFEVVTLYEKLSRRSRGVARKAAIKKRLESLEYQAIHDSFTDVMNKNSFFDMVEIQLQENTNEFHGMILFDLDNFKLVNDRLGHDVGDQVILHLANILKDKFRDNDIIGRFGGDEFIIFMKNVRDAECVQNRAAEVLHEVETSCEKKFSEVHVTASAGVVVEKNIFSSQEMFKYADIALYKAKQSGKNKYFTYEKNKE